MDEEEEQKYLGDIVANQGATEDDQLMKGKSPLLAKFQPIK